MNPSAYSGMHDWQDSIYFSIVTLATVGYGDITPLSHLARWTCSVEIVLGFVILVAALNTTLSVWLQRIPPSDSAVKVKPSDQSTEDRPSQKTSAPA
jgi:voltage-gated potassium channel Kch